MKRPHGTKDIADMTKLRTLRWGDDPEPPVWAQHTHMDPEKLKWEKKVKIREGIKMLHCQPLQWRMQQGPHAAPDLGNRRNEHVTDSPDRTVKWTSRFWLSKANFGF